MVYKGLLMGCTRGYWLGIIKKIYQTFGTEKFTWSDVQRRYPEISKSDLSRLKCSSWIKKRGKREKISLWSLPTEAIQIISMPQTKYVQRKPKIHTKFQNPKIKL